MIRQDIDLITPSTQAIARQLKAVPQQAFEFWVKTTPVRTGNARSNTHLAGNTIEADYAYAHRLDEGYSKQAPSGMSKPTKAFIDQAVKKILRK